MTVVLDASVAVCWVVPQAQSDEALALRTRFLVDVWAVPSAWPLEVTYTIQKLRRRRQVTPSAARRAALELATLHVRVAREHTGEAVLSIYDAAERFGVSTYDATYLMLAAELRAPLLTVDERLAVAARAAGVDVPSGGA